MKVVILAGGLGSRLGTMTEYIPKPMAKIGERPILWHIMKNFAAQGVNQFVISLGYKGEVIKDFFYNYPTLKISLFLSRLEICNCTINVKKIGKLPV
mgnify:CR=1 FL=1